MRVLQNILEHCIINRNIFIHYCRVAVRVVCTIAAVLIILFACQLDFTTGYGPKPRMTFALLDCTILQQVCRCKREEDG